MKEFTNDEKIIARNISKEYKWIARDDNGDLCIYKEKPKKSKCIWNISSGNLFDKLETLTAFNHMFSSIKWEDDEPVLIKDIYDPQIISITEREYLKTILKPFHNEIGYIEKVDYLADGGRHEKEYLFIKFRDGSFTFPDFDKGKMYTGMELNKEYTLKELGITYKEVES